MMMMKQSIYIQPSDCVDSFWRRRKLASFDRRCCSKL